MTGGSGPKSDIAFHGRDWVLLLRGVVAIVFAVLAFTWPSITERELVTLFGVYALSHGVLSLVGAIAGRGLPGSLLLGTEGAIGLWAGLFALNRSLPTPFASIVVIWLWAAGTGILQIAEGVRLRAISGAVWLALGGLVMVSFGLIVWLRPFILLTIIIARFALVWGICEVVSGARRAGSTPVAVG